MSERQALRAETNALGERVVECAGQRGVARVGAIYIRGEFAVTHYMNPIYDFDEEWFSVTHLPTGRCVNSRLLAYSSDNAINLCRLLSELDIDTRTAAGRTSAAHAFVEWHQKHERSWVEGEDFVDWRARIANGPLERKARS